MASSGPSHSSTDGKNNNNHHHPWIGILNMDKHKYRDKHVVAIEAVASHGRNPFNQKSISRKPGVQLLSVDIFLVFLL